MTGLDADRVERVVAAALCRTTLIARAAAATTAAAVGLLVVDDTERTVAVIAVVVASTASQLGVLTRWPVVVRHPVAFLAVDQVLLLLVLALSGGGAVFFVLAAGSAGLAGILLGMSALWLWAAQTVQGFVAAAAVLRSSQPPAEVAPFVLAAPMAAILCGLGAAAAASALTQQMHQSIRHVVTAQRSAAAAERARLARELHDSVAKTLRGMSLAALALPGSVGRQPALAAQLADTISRGADAASREARVLIGGLRLDSPDESFGETLRRICGAWTARTGIAAQVALDAVEPPVGTRYELSRIVDEALTNVARHAGASQARVVLAERHGVVTILIGDDGRGFRVPRDLVDLQQAGHTGLVGMSERARTVGGELTVDSSPGGGTLVKVRVPA